ncbi:hypothetical protein [Amycolatopsis sp. PS_44_ISF1]|uniref:hypothetical protein n=1 Tax=Amycolatopsis sp. PS_44_ISF1 TaxID=2974917 RepID=UPI0028DE2F40|nr:hypothetical protein [Amycolatopsis sp. PS_44_ISF1]MDT8915758.1 hypothetical protein [Amycolatopsis sp. PS_44_ISF1]MDT8916298.1 hypothetical protein [Amycolatopsis sp. PS_44_ISF1]
MSDTRYTAKTDIYAAPGVLAYLAGQEVPASAVENLSAQDKVAAARQTGPAAVKGAAKEA